MIRLDYNRPAEENHRFNQGIIVIGDMMRQFKAKLLCGRPGGRNIHMVGTDLDRSV